MVTHDAEWEAAPATAVCELIRITEVAREVLEDPHQHPLFRTPEEVYAPALVAFLTQDVEGHIS